MRRNRRTRAGRFAAGDGRARGPALADPAGRECLDEIAPEFRSRLTSIPFQAETLHRGASGALTELQTRQLGIIHSDGHGPTRAIAPGPAIPTMPTMDRPYPGSSRGGPMHASTSATTRGGSHGLTR